MCKVTVGGTDTSVVWDASDSSDQCFLKTNKQPSDQEHSFINNWNDMRRCNIFSPNLQNKLKINLWEKSNWNKMKSFIPSGDIDRQP